MSEDKPTQIFNDPHVTVLRYRVEVPEGVTLDDEPPSVEGEFGSFDLLVTASEATTRMKEHFASEGEARAAVDGELLRWRILEELEVRGSGLWFVFEDSEIVDRNPQSISATATVAPKPHAEASLVRRLRVPNIEDFVVSEDVAVMWSLYEAYTRGQDRLLPMAYTCLTRLRYRFGRDQDVAEACGVSRSVLKKLAELSTSGDATEARKWDTRSGPRTLTDAERRWIEDLLRILILRAGQHDADPSGERATMANLPDLHQDAT